MKTYDMHTFDKKAPHSVSRAEIASTDTCIQTNGYSTEPCVTSIETFIYPIVEQSLSRSMGDSSIPSTEESPIPSAGESRIVFTGESSIPCTKVSSMSYTEDSSLLFRGEFSMPFNRTSSLPVMSEFNTPVVGEPSMPVIEDSSKTVTGESTRHTTGQSCIAFSGASRVTSATESSIPLGTDSTVPLTMVIQHALGTEEFSLPLSNLAHKFCTKESTIPVYETWSAPPLLNFKQPSTPFSGAPSHTSLTTASNPSTNECSISITDEPHISWVRESNAIGTEDQTTSGPHGLTKPYTEDHGLSSTTDGGLSFVSQPSACRVESCTPPLMKQSESRFIEQSKIDSVCHSSTFFMDEEKVCFTEQPSHSFSEQQNVCMTDSVTPSPLHGCFSTEQGVVLSSVTLPSVPNIDQPVNCSPETRSTLSGMGQMETSRTPVNEASLRDLCSDQSNALLLNTDMKHTTKPPTPTHSTVQNPCGMEVSHENTDVSFVASSLGDLPKTCATQEKDNMVFNTSPTTGQPLGKTSPMVVVQETSVEDIQLDECSSSRGVVYQDPLKSLDNPSQNVQTPVGLDRGCSVDMSHASSAHSRTGNNERLLVVANRLPMTVHPSNTAEGEYTFSLSSGGLVSGLRGIKDIDFVWIGWPGGDVAVQHRTRVTEQCRACDCHPVYLDQAIIDLFYNGFCNNILWPLIHYIPPPIEIDSCDTYAEQWNAYYRANVAFVEAILEVYDDNDIVWVHDYHLMLVPKLLRARKPEARIGFIRCMDENPVTLVKSGDLPPQHRLLYSHACVQLLGLENTTQGIDASSVGGVFVYCAVIPIGIESEQFTQMLRDPSVRDAIRTLKAQFAKRKVILGVDRLDYMKGLPHKLNAFDRFLELHPEWNGRCVLVQLAVPSRTVVPEYQRLKSRVHELVGMINGKRGNLTNVPVHYLDQSLSLDELVALYRVADVALISSIRDGMNLVAYEFIACQAGKNGVLILSEFTGAAQSLGAGSIRINPWNLDETANAIYRALTMSKSERCSRHQYALNHVRVHTSQKWAEVFIESLRDASERNEKVRASVPQLLSWDTFLEHFSLSRNRLMLVDLVDALIPARGNRGLPMKKFKNLIKLPEDVLDGLRVLSSDNTTVVIITSAHPASVLERLFSQSPVCLAAEKGCVYRTSRGEWVRFVEEISSTYTTEAAAGQENRDSIASTSKEVAQNGTSHNYQGCNSHTKKLPKYDNVVPRSISDVVKINTDWIPGVKKVFEFFERRTPGSYTERTTGTLTWYWDDTLPDFGKQQSRELLVHLSAGPLSNTSNAEVEVVVGSRFIEVRSPQCSRHKLLQRILETEFNCQNPLPCFDFVVCIANLPRRDEDIHWLFDSQVSSRRSFFWNDTQGNSSAEMSLAVTPFESKEEKLTVTRDASKRDVTQQLAPVDTQWNVSPQRRMEKAQGDSSPAQFLSLQDNGRPVVYFIGVGSTISRAKYRLLSPYHVQALVKHMARRCEPDDERTTPIQPSVLCDNHSETSPTFRNRDEDLWRLRMTPQLGIIDDALSQSSVRPTLCSTDYVVRHQATSLSPYPLSYVPPYHQQEKGFNEAYLSKNKLPPSSVVSSVGHVPIVFREQSSLATIAHTNSSTSLSLPPRRAYDGEPPSTPHEIQPSPAVAPVASSLHHHSEPFLGSAVKYVHKAPSVSVSVLPRHADIHPSSPESVTTTTHKEACAAPLCNHNSSDMSTIETPGTSASIVSAIRAVQPENVARSRTAPAPIPRKDAQHWSLPPFIGDMVTLTQVPSFVSRPFVQDTVLPCAVGDKVSNTSVASQLPPHGLYRRSAHVNKSVTHHTSVSSRFHNSPTTHNLITSLHGESMSPDDTVMVDPGASLGLKTMTPWNGTKVKAGETHQALVTPKREAMSSSCVRSGHAGHFDATQKESKSHIVPQSTQECTPLLPTYVTNSYLRSNPPRISASINATGRHTGDAPGVLSAPVQRRMHTIVDSNRCEATRKASPFSAKHVGNAKSDDPKRFPSHSSANRHIFSFAGSVAGDWPPFSHNIIPQRTYEKPTSTFNTENRFPADYFYQPPNESSQPVGTVSMVAPNGQPPEYWVNCESGSLLKCLRHQEAQVRRQMNDPLLLSKEPRISSSSSPRGVRETKPSRFRVLPKKQCVPETVAGRSYFKKNTERTWRGAMEPASNTVIPSLIPSDTAFPTTYVTAFGTNNTWRHGAPNYSSTIAEPSNVVNRGNIVEHDCFRKFDRLNSSTAVNGVHNAADPSHQITPSGVGGPSDRLTTDGLTVHDVLVDRTTHEDPACVCDTNGVIDPATLTHPSLQPSLASFVTSKITSPLQVSTLSSHRDFSINNTPRENVSGALTAAVSSSFNVMHNQRSCADTSPLPTYPLPTTMYPSTSRPYVARLSPETTLEPSREQDLQIPPGTRSADSTSLHTGRSESQPPTIASYRSTSFSYADQIFYAGKNASEMAFSSPVAHTATTHDTFVHPSGSIGPLSVSSNHDRISACQMDASSSAISVDASNPYVQTYFSTPEYTDQVHHEQHPGPLHNIASYAQTQSLTTEAALSPKRSMNALEGRVYPRDASEPELNCHLCLESLHATAYSAEDPDSCGVLSHRTTPLFGSPFALNTTNKDCPRAGVPGNQHVNIPLVSYTSGDINYRHTVSIGSDVENKSAVCPSPRHAPKNVTATFKGPFESPLLSVGGVNVRSNVTFNDGYWSDSSFNKKSSYGSFSAKTNESPNAPRVMAQTFTTTIPFESSGYMPEPENALPLISTLPSRLSFHEATRQEFAAPSRLPSGKQNPSTHAEVYSAYSVTNESSTPNGLTVDPSTERGTVDTITGTWTSSEQPPVSFPRNTFHCNAPL